MNKIVNRTAQVRRRFFTLLELLIALAITVVLLSSILFFYRTISMKNAQIDKNEEREFTRRYLEGRLIAILSKATLKNTKGAFYTLNAIEGLTKSNQPLLLFCFDNGITLNKELSNEVLALLFVDKQETLSLALWPAPTRWEKGTTPPMAMRESLFAGVKQLRLSFFSAASLEKKSSADLKATDELPPLHSGIWQRDWKRLPHIVYIYLTTIDEGEMTFAIPIAKAIAPITYSAL